MTCVAYACRELAAHARADRARASPDLALAQAREEAVGCCRDRLTTASLGSEVMTTSAGSASSRAAQSLLDEPLCALPVAGLAEHGVTGGEVAGGRVAAYLPRPMNPIV